MNRDPKYQSGSEQADWQRRINDGLTELASGALVSAIRTPQAAWESKQPRLLLAGSFDPLHRGHVAMAEYAEGRFGAAVWYELALQNADKGQLNSSEVIRRLLPHLLPEFSARPGADRLAEQGPENSQRAPEPQFAPHGLLVSHLPTFLDKALALPNTHFLVGIDTWQRIVDGKYYAGGDRDRALHTIVDAGCRFVVFGRLFGDAFLDPDNDLGLSTLPPRIARAVMPVSGSQFRVDVSSTQLRSTPLRDSD